jgi:hypothetical protein
MGLMQKDQAMATVARSRPAMSGGKADRVASLLIASDKFKGSLSSSGVGAAVRRGLLAVNQHLDVRIVPIADGGLSKCLVLDDRNQVVEMGSDGTTAQCCG